jgi:Tfp pilus assembly protein PilF
VITFSPRHSRGVRAAGCALLILALSGGLSACSSDEPGKAATTAPSAVSSEKATPAGAAVQAGLDKHVKGDLDGAGADYQKALETDPENALALYNLGLLAQTGGDNDVAEERYRAALTSSPDYQPAVFNLAIVRKAAGDDAEAEQLYRRAIELRPGDAGANLNLGLLLRDTGRRVEGDARVAAALELNPEFVDPAAQ